MRSNSFKQQKELYLAVTLVFLTTVLTYGLFIPRLGFYRDDWYLVWAVKSLGPDGLLSLFKGDRPFLGWLYLLDFSVMGVSPLNWHIYALAIKFFSALGFLWLMRSLWPERKIETTFATLLFIVYPGFYQQPDALTFKQLLIAFGASLFSLAFTVNAIKVQKNIYKVIFTILAVLSAAFYIFIYEALIGMEAARFFLIGYLLLKDGKDWKQSFWQGAIRFSPYLLFAGSFIYWRIFLFEAKRRATSVNVVVDSYTSLHGIYRLLIEGGKDLIETPILAWAVPYYQSTASAIYRNLGPTFGIGLLVLAIGAGYYFLAKQQAPVMDVADDTSLQDWMPLGLLIVFFTTLPVVLAGRNVIFDIQWDRYTYQSVFGVALLVGGFVFYGLKGNARWLVLGFLILSGVTTQVSSAIRYRDFWTVQHNAWWQLTWRVPQVKDDAMLVVGLPPGFGLAEEYEAWGPINLIYYPNQPLKIPAQIMYDKIWLDMERGTTDRRVVRGTVRVPHNYGKVVVLSQPTYGACLHLLDGTRAEQYITESFEVRSVVKYSNKDLIDPLGKPVVPPSEIFGSEPERDWCYYYQKMDLARQNEDWQLGASLADEAISMGLEPLDFSEWMPALEAYAHLNDIGAAKMVAGWMEDDKYIFSGLCAQFKALHGQPAAPGYERDYLADLLCIRE